MKIRELFAKARKQKKMKSTLSASVMATTKKSDQIRTSAFVVGVKSWPSGELMTYDNGKILPYWWFGDVPDHWLPSGDSPEEDYEIRMLNGFPRDHVEESTLDMSKIPESSLPDEISDEEVYAEILAIGLPRMPEVEAEIDMELIDPELLK